MSTFFSNDVDPLTLALIWMNEVVGSLKIRYHLVCNMNKSLT